MDYKLLLEKYIEHVCSYEGTEFMPDIPEYKNPHPDDFTEEEVRALWSLSGNKHYRDQA
jgi:hypothetical protein